MAKINRFDGDVQAFASNATGTNRTIFGDTAQSDDLDDNINADFLSGWEIIGVNENPTKQDFNALAYTISYLVAYLHQMGVSEWNTTQEFAQYGLCIGSDGKLYQSVVATNTGNNPTTDDGSNWTVVTSAANIEYDNSDSGLVASDVKAALDELKEAANIDYDNSDSGLAATNVKAALDELDAAITAVTTGYAKYSHVETSGTDAGDFVKDGWRTRELNTEDSDTDGIGSLNLATNRITLQAGTYIISASAPAFNVSEHSAQLYDYTNSAVLLEGTSEATGGSSNTTSRSIMNGKIVLAAETAIIIRHYCKTTKSTDGLGRAATIPDKDEVYTIIEINKIA